MDAVVASTQGTFVASLPPPLALATPAQPLPALVVTSGPQGGFASLDAGDASSDWINHQLNDQLANDNNAAVGVHANSLLSDEGPDDEIEAQVRRL